MRQQRWRERRKDRAVDVKLRQMDGQCDGLAGRRGRRPVDIQGRDDDTRPSLSWALMCDQIVLVIDQTAVTIANPVQLKLPTPSVDVSPLSNLRRWSACSGSSHFQFEVLPLSTNGVYGGPPSSSFSSSPNPPPRSTCAHHIASIPRIPLLPSNLSRGTRTQHAHSHLTCLFRTYPFSCCFLSPKIFPPLTPSPMSPSPTLATSFTLEDIQIAADPSHRDSPILVLAADAKSKGYQAISLPLTTPRWHTRWKNMCIMSCTTDAHNEEAIAAEKEAEAWRKSPSFLLDEVTITGLGEMPPSLRGLHAMCH